MVNPSQYPPLSRPEDDLDPDWAPSLPSIWDEEEDDEAEFDAYPMATAPPWPMAGDGAGRLDPAAWVRAEDMVGRALSHATACVVRLDERLLRMRGEARDGARLRIALESIPDLLWSEGVRVRPEYLALADAHRIGGGEDAPVLARAAWAVRRMTAGSGLDARSAEPSGVRLFLGLSTTGRASDGLPDAGHELPVPLEARSIEPAALAEWCRSIVALGDVHPLTRAAAAAALWPWLGVTEAGLLLEPAIVAGVCGADAGQGGLIVLPPGRLQRARGRDLPTSLEMLLVQIAEGASAALMLLDRVVAWQERAERATVGLKGRAPGALIALLAARPVVSARDVAGALNLTDRHARRLIEHFQDLGMVRELTGHTRFRFWAATV